MSGSPLSLIEWLQKRITECEQNRIAEIEFGNEIEAHNYKIRRNCYQNILNKIIELQDANF